ncbi:hypothetical protein ACJMK2_044297 [Sinanodonta woodiana]|uniref:SOCS box domain-containing protein n=1 Tax=Sinanodonta woodiana TaxID=1069815 RepID=A0ABD3VZK6_SINWO
MGNQQILGGPILPTSCIPGHRQIMNAASGSRNSQVLDLENDTEEESITSDDEVEEEESRQIQLSEAAKLENVIISDDTEQLKQLVSQDNIDLNLLLNEKGETALILAVKLSHLEIVRILLSHPNCNKNCLNVRNFSALDVALITAFDNRLEPRQTICWEIIERLFQADACPASRDAMMYVVRTALKFCDEEFLYRLILLALECSNSIILHELFLQKLHRYQPIYIGSLDPILIRTVDFTIKLVRISNGKNLGHVVNSMVYYLESYWSSRDNKISTFKKLIIYATAAGWSWTKRQMILIERVCPQIGIWCRFQKHHSFSLTQLCRVSFRHHVQHIVPDAIQYLPHPLPGSLRDYLLLNDMDELMKLKDLKMGDISL